MSELTRHVYPGDDPARGKQVAMQSAQRRANLEKRPFGVWEHVGLYGKPEGDTPARHSFRVQPLEFQDPPDDWTMVAAVDPEEPKEVLSGSEAR
jgi:hypothetical protein